MELIAICLAGLEDIVIDDLQRHFGPFSPNLQIVALETSSSGFDMAEKHNGKTIHRGEAACGKILLKNVCTNVESSSSSCLSSSHSSVSEILKNIRSVQYMLVHLNHSKSFPEWKNGENQNLDKDAKTTTLSFLTNSVGNETNIHEAYQQWLGCISPEYVSNYEALVNGCHLPKFCVRCIRNGQHSLGSMEIAKVIGAEIFKRTSWVVDLSQMDIEIVCILMNETVIMGINIPSDSKPFLSSKLPSEVRLPVINNTLSPSLRPSTAFMMVQLAKPQKGDFLVDCMTGSGSVMTEGAYSHGCVSFGGDANKILESTLVEVAKLVETVSKNQAIVEGMLWSAHRLPLRNGCADIAIIDIPFSKLGAVIPKYYRARPPMFVEEIARVLSIEGGRAVFLVQNHRQLLSCIDSIYFESTQWFPVNIGGYVGYMITTQRTSVPFRNSAVEVVSTVGTGKDTVNSKKRPYSFVNHLQ